MDKQAEIEHQWALYRVYRSNAIWFCQQRPMKMLLHKHINPDTGVYEGALNECTERDLKKNTEGWIEKTKSMWKKLIAEEHPYALDVAKQHISFKTPIGQKIITTVEDADNTGNHKCLCPDCMLAEIRLVQNLELKLAL